MKWIKINESATKRGYDVNGLTQKLSRMPKGLRVVYHSEDGFGKELSIVDAVVKNGKVVLYGYDTETGMRPPVDGDTEDWD